MSEDVTATFQHNYRLARRVINDRVLPRNLQRSAGPPPDLRKVAGESGPVRQWHEVLNSFRRAISETGTRLGKGEGGALLLAAADDIPAGPSSHKRKYPIQVRCAALKFFRHLYMEQARGAQAIWVYAPPKTYTRWVFAELENRNFAPIDGKLAENDEVFTPADRQLLCQASQMALAWAVKAVALLGNPSPLVKTKLDFWFATDKTSTERKDKFARILLAGFKRIAGVLNSNLLVFSDEPLDRLKKVGNGTGWDAFAFVNPDYEQMNVIYAQGGMLAAGHAGRLWETALTVIHELAHYEEAPDEHISNENVAPRGGKITPRIAIQNADTWAHFAADINGMLPVADKFKGAWGD
jgi:hypothetical protein